jgi:BirA family transcriptional regulator, biotin operon repressor / biotin---[acetyl-CoA-carboxylase] ligase
MSDLLVAEELKSQLNTALIGREVMVLEQTTSTNDAISRLISSDAHEGLVLFAEHQIAGRGQRGNRWESAAGKGLWFSVLLRPQIEIHESGQLTVWAIEAIANVIRTHFGLQPVIKLPNDVQIHGRKVAGVLVEMRAQQREPHLAVVGIGVNVNQSTEDFPAQLHAKAISLAIALGQPVDRRQFAIALLRDLDRTYTDRFAEAS